MFVFLWLTSLSVIFSRFIRVAANGIISIIFGWVISHCTKKTLWFSFYVIVKNTDPEPWQERVFDHVFLTLVESPSTETLLFFKFSLVNREARVVSFPCWLSLRHYLHLIYLSVSVTACPFIHPLTHLRRLSKAHWKQKRVQDILQQTCFRAEKEQRKNYKGKSGK